MSWTTSSLVGAAAMLSLTVASTAHGNEDEGFSLSWQAPTDCPSRDEVRRGIARLLGGEIRVPLPPNGNLQAHARVSHGSTWAVTIETESAGRAGRRFIEAASCQDLADATVLIIALMIDPDAVAAHAKQPPTTVATAPAADTPAPRKAPRTTKALLGIHTAVSQGTLPSLDAGVGAGLGLAGRHWRLELRGTYGLRRDQKVTVAPDAYGRFNFVAASLTGCLNLGRAGLAYGPCADAELGVVSAQGFGKDPSFVSLPARTLWWAIGAGLYASMPLGHHLSLPVHADVLAPARRPEFVFRNDAGTATRVFRAPAAGVRVSVGVELAF